MRQTARFAAGLCGLTLVAATVPAVWGGWTPSPSPAVITDSDKAKTDVAVGASTNGDAIALWSEMADGNTALKASVRDEGVWSAPGTLDSGPGHQAVNDAHIVIDQNGFATAVWVRRYDDSTKKLWFATRPAGGPWSAAAEVSTGIQAEVLSVAITPAGAVTATWQSPTGGGVSAADKAAGATTWTVTQVSASGGSPSIAAASDNRTAIAYSTGGLLAVKVRTGTGSWASVTAETASANRPETPGVDVAQEPVIGFGADGALHAAWWEYDDEVEPALEEIYTSSRSTGGIWTVHPDPISAPDTITHAKGIEGDAQGNVTVIWESVLIGPGVENRYFAATRVSGTWEAPYPLTGADPGEGLSTPRLVLDAEGTFTAVWGQDFTARANRRTAAGDWLDPEENLSALSASFVAAALDATGEPIAAWVRFSFENSTAHYRIETRTYDSNEPPGDTTGPVTMMVKPTKPFYLSQGVPLSWTVEDPEGSPIGGSRIRYRAATWKGGYPADYENFTTFFTGMSYSFPTKPGRSYCFQVQSQDDIPNIGDWSTEKCTATPVDDRTPVRAGAWTKLTGSGFYRGTALKSTDKGATLTLDGATGKRIALVVSKAPGWGRLQVKFAGELLGTWSLAATRTKHRVVIPVHLASEVETGKLVVKVVSDDGKRVQVDGVLVGRV